MTERRDKDLPVDSGAVEEWDEFAETMEPEWEKAHKPHLKSEVLTVRLGSRDMQRLKRLSDRLGMGHSTLARVILRNALRHEELPGEEAATLALGATKSSRRG